MNLYDTGQALMQARKAMTPKITQKEAGERIGVSRATIYRIESGDAYGVSFSAVANYAELVNMELSVKPKKLRDAHTVEAELREEAQEIRERINESAKRKGRISAMR